MAYKIGTRVKKVRGKYNIGATGVVCSGVQRLGHTCDHLTRARGRLYDCYVRYDAPPVGWSGKIVSAGVWAACSGDWSPITPDGHRAGVKGECSLLDELLSRENNNETVK